MENSVIWKLYVVKEGNKPASRPDNGKLCRWLSWESNSLELKEFTDQSVNGLPKTWNGSTIIRAWRYLE